MPQLHELVGRQRRQGVAGVEIRQAGDGHGPRRMQVHHREVIGVGLVPREVERRFLGGLGAADEGAVSSSRERLSGVSSPKGMPVGVARMPPSTRRLMFPAEPPVRPRRKTERQAPASRFRPVSQSGQVLIVFSLVFLARRARGCAGGLPARPRDPLPGRRDRRPGYGSVTSGYGLNTILMAASSLSARSNPALMSSSLNSSVMSGLTSTSPWATGRRASGHQT